MLEGAQCHIGILMLFHPLSLFSVTVRSTASTYIALLASPRKKEMIAFHCLVPRQRLKKAERRRVRLARKTPLLSRSLCGARRRAVIASLGCQIGVKCWLWPLSATRAFRLDPDPLPRFASYSEREGVIEDGGQTKADCGWIGLQQSPGSIVHRDLQIRTEGCIREV